MYLLQAVKTVGIKQSATAELSDPWGLQATDKNQETDCSTHRSSFRLLKSSQDKQSYQQQELRLGPVCSPSAEIATAAHWQETAAVAAAGGAAAADAVAATVGAAAVSAAGASGAVSAAVVSAAVAAA